MLWGISRSSTIITDTHPSRMHGLCKCEEETSKRESRKWWKEDEQKGREDAKSRCIVSPPSSLKNQ